MEREITLKDYGRVLWAGRWVLLAAAIGAALIGLITSFVRETTYTASSIVYLGVALTPNSFQPVSTPLTTPVTAQKVLRGDEFVKRAADGAGVDIDRVRDGVDVSVERIPGAAGGNQPTVATLRYTDTDKATAIAVTNAYAEGAFRFVDEDYQREITALTTLVDTGRDRVTTIQSTLDRLRGGGGGSEAVLNSLVQELSVVQLQADENTVALAKTQRISRPYVVSKAESASSSAAPGRRIRSVIFGVILGLILGAIATFIWRGSPTSGDTHD